MDVSADQNAAREMMKRNIMGVPAFIIGDDVVVGLDRERILQLVDHRLTTCENCGQRLRVPTDKGPITATCPKCKNQFEVEVKSNI